MIKNIAVSAVNKNKNARKAVWVLSGALMLVLLPLAGAAFPRFMERPPAPERPAATPQATPQTKAQPESLRQLEALDPIGNTIVRHSHNGGVRPSFDFNNRADIYLNHGLYAEAEAAFKNLPQTGLNRLNVARAQVGQNKTTQALNTLKPILPQNLPEVREFHAQLLLHLAEVAHLSDNTSAAERNLNLFEAAYSEGDTTAVRTRYHRVAETLGRVQRTPTKRQSFWGVDATTTPESAQNKTFFRVGVLLPLSGNMGPVGRDILRGLQLSLFDHQNQNGNENIVTILYPQDTVGTPQGAAAAAARALKLGVDMVVGPLAANNVEAAASTLRRNNVPMVAFSSTAAIAAPDVHLLGYIPQQQARAAARAGASRALSSGQTNLAALVPSTEFGYEVLGAYTDELQALGLGLSQTGFYNPQNADVGNALNDLLNLQQSKVILQAEKKRLTKVRDELGSLMDKKDARRLAFLQKAKPEATIEFSSLFLPATATGLNLITAQMATYDADKADFLLLGTAAWGAATLNQNPPEYVNNAAFFAPAPPAVFEASFKTAYAADPHPLAVLGYDAATIAQSVAREVTNAGFSASQALLRPEGFSGLGGPVKFNADGVTQRAYGAWQLDSNGARLVASAPKLLPPVNLTVVRRESGKPRIQIPTFDTGRFIPF